jgi:hypothetical protein
MTVRKMIAAAVVLQLMAVPALAQTTSDKDQNAHHYEGGPKTEVPHMMKHPSAPSSTTGTTETTGVSGGHHYSGGPKTEVPHHMGEKKQ